MPKGTPKDKPTMIGRLREALLDLYAKHQADGTLPTNGRFLFYELEMQGLAFKKKDPKAPRGSMPDADDVSDALTSLRERGDIPWDDIVDETRFINDKTGYSNLAVGLLAKLHYVVELDYWAGKYPLILTESRSLAGTLRPLCNEYRALLAATNGQCTGFFHTKVKPLLDRRVIGKVLYLGDHDIAGGDIEAHSRETVQKIVGVDWFSWQRLAVTEAQVSLYGLTPIEKTDSRFKGGRKYQAVECEALSQKLIFDIVRTKLEELLPEPLSSVLAREEKQRQLLEAAIQAALRNPHVARYF
jgi:hypothetical protein